MTCLVDSTGNDGMTTVFTMDSPPVNALGAELRGDLTSAFEALEAPNLRARVVVLRGARHRFCAGGDINEMADTHGEAAAQELHASFAKLYAAVRNCPIPTIAVVEGYAMGGGFELLLSCDLCFVTPETQMAASAVNMGLVESAHTLAHRIPRAWATQILFAGERFDGIEAARIGVATRCILQPDLDAVVMQMCERISSRAPLSVRAAKRLLSQAALDQSGTESAARESWLTLQGSADHSEALEAFSEHRTPVFKGM